jgi:hypothetical protein
MTQELKQMLKESPNDELKKPQQKAAGIRKKAAEVVERRRWKEEGLQGRSEEGTDGRRRENVEVGVGGTGGILMVQFKDLKSSPAFNK